MVLSTGVGYASLTIGIIGKLLELYNGLEFDWMQSSRNLPQAANFTYLVIIPNCNKWSTTTKVAKTFIEMVCRIPITVILKINNLPYRLYKITY